MNLRSLKTLAALSLVAASVCLAPAASAASAKTKYISPGIAKAKILWILSRR